MIPANIDLELMDRANFTFNGTGLDCNMRHILEALEGEEYTLEDGFTVIYTGDVDVVTKVEEAKIKEENTLYQKFRAFSYPSVGDQLDLLWHAIDDETLDKTSDFYTKLKKVKDDNPKG